MIRNTDFQQNQDFPEEPPKRPPKATKGEIRTHSQYRTARRVPMISPRIAKDLHWEPQNHGWLRDGAGKKQKTKSLGFICGRGTNVAHDMSLRNQNNGPAHCSSKASGQKCCLLHSYFLSRALDTDVGLRTLVTTNCISASSMP